MDFVPSYLHLCRSISVAKLAPKITTFKVFKQGKDKRIQKLGRNE